MFWFPQAAMFINRGNVNAIMHILMMAAASRHYDRHKSLCCLNTSTRSQRKRSIWLSAPLPCCAEGCVSIFLQGGKAYLILLSASVRMLIIYITGRVLCNAAAQPRMYPHCFQLTGYYAAVMGHHCYSHSSFLSLSSLSTTFTPLQSALIL